MLADRVKENSTSSGLGDIALAGASNGFYAVSEQFADGESAYFFVIDTVTGDWEACTATYVAAGNKLTRGTLHASSTGARINFAGNSMAVFVQVPSEKTAYSKDGFLVLPGGAKIAMDLVDGLATALSAAQADAIGAAASDATAKADAAQAGAISEAAADATAKAGVAKSDAISTAAIDATTKADAARASAISAAALDASTKSEAAKNEAISIAAGDATTKAENARSAAVAASASDATTKAAAAQVAAIASAAADASTKANAAQAAAISTAAADASEKADAAQAAAIAAAATDATAKAAAAQSAAIAAAASDATSKASVAQAAALDAAKTYADALAQGARTKPACYLSTSPSDTTLVLSGLYPLGGGTPSAGHRVLVKDLIDKTKNGIWVASSLDWTRAEDANIWPELPGAQVFVEAGDNAGTSWICIVPETGTIGTSNIVFNQNFGVGTYRAVNGVKLTGTEFSLDTDVAATRTYANDQAAAAQSAAISAASSDATNKANNAQAAAIASAATDASAKATAAQAAAISSAAVDATTKADAAQAAAIVAAATDATTKANNAQASAITAAAADASTKASAAQAAAISAAASDATAKANAAQSAAISTAAADATTKSAAAQAAATSAAATDATTKANAAQAAAVIAAKAARVVSITGATGGTITPTGDSTDQYIVTALGAAATFAIPSGTPGDGQRLLLVIKDNGTARALSWTTTAGGYRAMDMPLPTTTVAGKTHYVGLIYNAASSFWAAFVAQEA